jgi:hypothetical protein
METGISDIDVFETLKTTDINQQSDADVVQSYGDNNEFRLEAQDIIFDSSNPFGDLPVTSFTADSGVIHTDTTNATADAQ